MKNRRAYLLVVIAVLGAVVGGLSFKVRGSGNQSRSPKSESPVKTTVLNSSSKSKASTSTSAARNDALRNDLSWTFGGKQQRGWYLYDLLLSETLKTNDEPHSDDFADAVTKWQKRRGLSASGVLDQNSWMAMVS
ncbi:MAG TPA: hypothetical protein VFS77_00030, partial [Pyrinomonadaceae bacterium]|nr:hypothetical protein [Pyrinomonadaceae bacterium]